MEPGTTLGTYEIVELLGQGGMGRVYRARDTKLGRDVAIKMLLGELANDPKFLARLEREAKVLASINHPNIATIFGFETAEGAPFLVLEFLEGQTLDQCLRHGGLPVGKAVNMGIQVARALEAAHEKDVVHRDLKPSNVMLCPKDVTKVLDFGIAKAFQPADSELTSFDTRAADLTEAGTLVGTAPYMSPEQIRDHALLDRRTDVWSFGCVLFEALTGQGAFTRETLADTLAAILEYEPRWELLPDASPPIVEQILRRCLRKDFDRRARDLRDVRLELEEALGGPGTATGTATGTDIRPEAAETAATAVGETPGPSIPAESAGDGDSGPQVALTQGERRQVTLLASAVSGYGAMVENLPPSDTEKILGGIQCLAREVVESHDGIVNSTGEGELTALFGVPAAREDDTLRAVRAAFELHAKVKELTSPAEERIGEPVRMQTAVHSGLVVARPGQGDSERYAIAGTPVQTADRLCAEAMPDEILLSGDSHRAAGPFFDTEQQDPITLRGSSDAVVPYRVTGESGQQSRLEVSAQHGLTTYTGRETELAAVRSMFTKAATGAGQLVAVEGEAGAGKSRLLYEFCNGVDRDSGRLVHGRCRSGSGSVPYLPFIDLLKGILEVEGDATSDVDGLVARILAIDADLEHFVPLYLHLLSVESEAHELPHHLQGDDFRIAMLEALAAIFTLPTKRGPIVMVLEDWHWVDEASHEVLRQLASMVSAFALLVIVTYRPERVFEWGRAAEPQRLTLEPLDEEASVDIIKSTLGVASFPAELAHLIHERTGGNPFFLEELCYTLEEDGTIEIQDEQAVLHGALDRIHLPDTVQAVILSRLDRLDRNPREVLRLASVVGREFGRRTLEETAAAASDVSPALEELKELGLVQQVAVVPEAVYRFKHALTQEVAYGSLLQHQRRALHGDVGDAFEKIYAGRLDEHAANLAHHFGAAEQWEKAITYGKRSAEKAGQLQRFDEVLANLENIREWLLRLPEDTDRQCRLVDTLLEMERACETLGKRSQQQELIDAARLILDPMDESTELAETEIRQGELLTLLGRFEDANRPLENAIRLSRKLEDPVRERVALRGLGFLRWQQERFDEALECNEKALEVSRAIDDPDAIARDLSNLTSVLRTAGQPDRAMEHMKEALELTEASGNPSNHAYLLNILGKVYRALGDDDAALEVVQRAREICEENRLPLGLCFHLSALANIHWERGNTDECVELYEEMARVSRSINYAEGLSMATHRLGDLLFSLRRDDEALPYLHENATLSVQLHDQENEALAWMRIAEIHERAARHDEAASAWEKVRRLREETRDFKGEIEAHAGLARARSSLDGPASLAHYEDALTLAIGVNDPAKQGALLNSMAITEWRQGNHERALEYYERALALFEQIEDAVHEGLVLNSIAVTLKDMGKPQEALTRAEDAVAVNRATGQQLLEGHSLAVLGDLHLEMDNPDEALNHYQASLDLRREIGDRHGEGWMLQRLSSVYAAKGITDLAGSYANEARTLAEENDDAELQQACSELS